MIVAGGFRSERFICPLSRFADFFTASLLASWCRRTFIAREGSLPSREEIVELPERCQ